MTNPIQASLPERDYTLQRSDAGYEDYINGVIARCAAAAFTSQPRSTQTTATGAPEKAEKSPEEKS